MTADDLRQWAEKQGYTYDAAAQALGISRAAWSNMLNGRAGIDLRTALACAAIDKKIKPWPGDRKATPELPHTPKGSC